MKLYYWPSWGGDYYPGMAVVLANTKKEAIKTVMEREGGCRCKVLNEIDAGDLVCQLCLDLLIEPSVFKVDKPMAFVNHGGR
jgi:hypothetical protein